MEIERYKEILMCIQNGKINTIGIVELDIVLEYLQQGKGKYYDFKFLPDGSTFFRKRVLETILQERASRSARVM